MNKICKYGHLRKRSLFKTKYFEINTVTLTRKVVRSRTDVFKGNYLDQWAKLIFLKYITFASLNSRLIPVILVNIAASGDFLEYL